LHPVLRVAILYQDVAAQLAHRPYMALRILETCLGMDVLLKNRLVVSMDFFVDFLVVAIDLLVVSMDFLAMSVDLLVVSMDLLVASLL
jgi:hypothetical protein